MADLSAILHAAYGRLELKHLTRLCKKYRVDPWVFRRLPYRMIGIVGPEIVFATGFHEDGSLEDLIYVEPAAPRRWRLELGVANWLGGWDERIDDLRFAPDPMTWLRWGGAGMMPLNEAAKNQLHFVKADARLVA